MQIMSDCIAQELADKLKKFTNIPETSKLEKDVINVRKNDLPRIIELLEKLAEANKNSESKKDIDTKKVTREEAMDVLNTPKSGMFDDSENDISSVISNANDIIDNTKKC